METILKIFLNKIYSTKFPDIRYFITWSCFNKILANVAQLSNVLTHWASWLYFYKMNVLFGFLTQEICLFKAKNVQCMCRSFYKFMIEHLWIKNILDFIICFISIYMHFWGKIFDQFSLFLDIMHFYIVLDLLLCYL